MQRLKRWIASRWVSIAVAVATVGIFVAVVGWHLFVDSPPPDDSDLVMERSEVADEDNGYVLVAIGEGRIDWGDRGGPPDSLTDSGDVARAREVIEKNQDILERFDESFERPAFQVPGPGIAGSMAFGQSGLLDLVRLATVRAQWLHREGRLTESLTEFLKILRLARRTRDGEGGLSVWITGLAIEGITLRRIHSLVVNEELSRGEISLLLDGLGRRRPVADVLADTLRRTYTESHLDPEELEGSWSLEALLYLPNETNAMLADVIRANIENAALPASDRENVPYPRLPSLTLGSFEIPITFRNYQGVRLVAGYTLPEKLLQRADQLKFRTRALKAIAALEGHELAHGALPEKLDGLIPEFLFEVPLDPYNGRPLHYDREKRVVWSFGRGESSSPSPAEALSQGLAVEF